MAASERLGVGLRIRFYAELNDFLPSARRGREFAVGCAGTATAKHVIEAIGVPHTEVELILVDGAAARFSQRLHDGQRVSVYPGFHAFAVPAAWRAGGPVRQDFRFIADAHLGGLARMLRMAGFNTLYRNDYADCEIAQLASAHGRIVLTRDRDLLKHRAVERGCFVRATRAPAQFNELIRRYGLAGAAQPFTRCLLCNSTLQAADAQSVRDRLPPSVLARRLQVSLCPDCRRVYWRGTHWQRMCCQLAAALGNDGLRAAEDAR